MLEMFVGMFVFFYMGIESLLILNRDLKTKQSHMLWMVPMQSWKILGAKYIAAILQIFFISAAYVLAAIACILSLIAKWMHGKSFLKGFALVQSGFSREIWIGSHLWQSFCFSSLHGPV